MLRCTKCEKLKKETEFGPGKKKNGLASWCRECVNNGKKNSPSSIKGTKEYLKRIIWQGMNSRPVNGKYSRKYNDIYTKKKIRIEMTKEDVYAWVDTIWAVAQKILANGGTPSVNRIDNDGHYTLDNIEMISHRENCKRN